MRLIAFSVLLVFFTSCYSPEKKVVWNADYEENLFKQVDSELKPIFPIDDKRKDLVTFIIKRLKTELPNGVESVTPDSLKKLSTKLGIEYGFKNADKGDIGMVPMTRPWTPQFENTLRKAFASDLPKNSVHLSEATCDCIIGKLKIVYPDSVIVPFPKDVVYRVSKECFEEMKK